MSNELDKLVNPTTYLHAALRGFVSSAYHRVNELLKQNFDTIFNRGHGTPYPDLKTLRAELRVTEKFWRSRNAFIADLIHAAATNLTERDIFLALTNYFFCYVKVDRQSNPNNPLSTVRVLFPVDVDCGSCPLGPVPSVPCHYSCFRFTFFPFKPPEMEHSKYDGHFKTAQFAMADASFAAAAPDLANNNAPEVTIAPAMVPLLFNQPLLFRDVGLDERLEEYRVLANSGVAKDRLLVARRSFREMNSDLGIRCDAILPLQVEPPYMPGFGRELISEYQGWVPGFPDSSPFCIELYSPMPDWFSPTSGEHKTAAIPKRLYSVHDSLTNKRETSEAPPVPRIFDVMGAGNQQGKGEAEWDQVHKILALGFNLQHYSELMAISFIHLLREVLTRGAYDAFALTLEKEYRKYRSIGSSEPLPDNIPDFLDFVRKTPRLLANILTSSDHGILLEPDVVLGQAYELCSLKGVQRLARDVEHLARVEELPFEGVSVPYCDPAPAAIDCRRILEECDTKAVLPRLAAEVIKNHRRPGQSETLRFHLCFDRYQQRLSLHFCSPTDPSTPFELETYLNLRQGLPQRKRGNRGGIGLALSRVIAEAHGFGYVIGLGRQSEPGPRQSSFDVQAYRRNLHTRIYFGGPV